MLDRIVDDYVWPITLGASAGSVAIFFGLVILRFFSERRRSVRRSAQKRIEEKLSAHIAKPLKDLKAVLIKRSSDIEIVAETAPALLRTLKGESYRRLRDSLEGIDLYAWSLEQMRHRNTKRKIAAIGLLGHWADSEAQEYLSDALDDRHHMVQLAAMEALARSGDLVCLPRIIAKFKAREAFSAPIMTDIFLNFGAGISGQLTTLLLEPDAPVRLLSAALTCLAKVGSRDEVSKVALPLCRHESPEIRAIAYRSLALRGAQVPSDLLLAGAEDPDWRVREFTANCAAAISPLPAAILSQLFCDANWLVALRAGQVMLASGAAGRRLMDTMARGDPRVAERSRMLRAETRRRERTLTDDLA